MKGGKKSFFQLQAFSIMENSTMQQIWFIQKVFFKKSYTHHEYLNWKP